MNKKQIAEFEQKVTEKGLPAAERLYNQSPFMRYRLDLDEHINENFDVYEEKVFRYLLRKCFRNPYRNDSLWWTESTEKIAQNLKLSDKKVRTVIDSIESKGFIEKEKRHVRTAYTYIITLPEKFGRYDIPDK